MHPLCPVVPALRWHASPAVCDARLPAVLVRAPLPNTVLVPPFCVAVLLGSAVPLCLLNGKCCPDALHGFPCHTGCHAAACVHGFACCGFLLPTHPPSSAPAPLLYAALVAGVVVMNLLTGPPLFKVGSCSSCACYAQPRSQHAGAECRFTAAALHCTALSCALPPASLGCVSAHHRHGKPHCLAPHLPLC